MGTFEDDVKAMVKQTTEEAKFYINRNATLYRIMANNPDPAVLKDKAEQWGRDHDDEFGSLFMAELDAVDWEKVAKDCF